MATTTWRLPERMTRGSVGYKLRTASDMGRLFLRSRKG